MRVFSVPRPDRRVSFRTVKRSISLALVAVGFSASIALAFVGCGGTAIDGQGEGCKATTDCPTGNDLKCLPLPNGNGGSCQIQCDTTKTGSCPSGQACELQATVTLVTICVPTMSGSGGSGTTGTGTGTSTASSTSTGG